jgi:glycosyltransferase involved in cell wall biosynthesis
MKVIFTIDTLAQGGAEQSTLETIRNFSSSVESVVVYFYSNHRLKDAFEQIDCKIIFLDIHGKYNFYVAVKKLIEVFKNEQPDIVVSTLYRSSIISRFACLLLRIPLIGTFVSDSYIPERKKLFKGIKKVFYYSTWALDCITARIPTGYISNSVSIAKTNANSLFIPMKRVTVVHRGRDSSQFTQWIKPTDNNSFVIAAVGRLVDLKWYPLLVQAVHELKDKFPHLRVIIYGEGIERKNIENYIHELGVNHMIQLAGNKSLAWENLYQANAYINTSIYEGFSGALIEAMLVGLPMIVSNISMNLEAVTNNETAIVFESKNLQDLVNSITSLIENYDNKLALGVAARKKAIEYFDIKVVIRKYEETLRKILLNAKK